VLREALGEIESSEEVPLTFLTGAYSTGTNKNGAIWDFDCDLFVSTATKLINTYYGKE
jgi:hypothetical protein